MPQTQLIILIAAAAVAAVVLARLFMILGRRTGAEPEGRVPAWARDKVTEAPPPVPALPLAPGLEDIRRADKAFDADKFLEGARTAYRLIVTAFEKGDREALKPLLSPEVYDGFDGAIAARGTAPGPYHFTDIREARIVSGAVENAAMEITVSFAALFDTAEAVGAPHEVTDVWTFARPVGAADPNWTLVSTSGPAQ